VQADAGRRNALRGRLLRLLLLERAAATEEMVVVLGEPVGLVADVFEEAKGIGVAGQP
jgi:hypothetical protein